MRTYTDDNVFEAALKRMRWIFDEFENVVVNFSGGKDSTVILQLALRVAEEKGRLPLPVLFLDQEAEWDTVIEYIRGVMADPRVEPLWLQAPFKINNSSSASEPWLYCWEPGKTWIREKEDISIKENDFGGVLFYDMLDAFIAKHFKGQPVVCLTGIRCEESPSRKLGLTSYETYKGVTWGMVKNKKTRQFNLCPIYDWSYTDVWKAIHDNDWPYCPIYDYMYQYGLPVQQMRVSSISHETALKTLYYLQEIEADTWNRVTTRLNGLNTVKNLREDFMCPEKLPFMFKDWWEYRDHLLENLIDVPEKREALRRKFKSMDAIYDQDVQHQLVKTQIATILVYDYEGTKLSAFAANFGAYSKNAGARGGMFGERRNARLKEQGKT